MATRTSSSKKSSRAVKSYDFVHEDNEGNKYYPHTKVHLVHTQDDKTIGDWVTEKGTELDTAKNNATTQANYAKAQGDYAKAEGAKVDSSLTALNNKVTVDGQSETNIDFIGRKVAQSGLVFEKHDKSKTTLDGLSINSDYINIFYVGKVRQWGRFLFETSRPLNLCVEVDNQNKLYTTINSANKQHNIVFTLKPISNILISINRINGTMSVYQDSLFLGSTSISMPNTSASLSHGDDLNVEHYLCYNRPLAPAEIAHNFQVLNNSPSINAITTTDSTGKSSILSLATDSEHVTMRNGFNQEEAYTGVLKTMAKDFSMDAQGKISVSNGLSCGKVLGLTMSGQTVKNLIHPTSIKGTTPTFGYYPVSTLQQDFTVLDSGKTYTLSYNVAKTLNKILRNTPVITFSDNTKLYQGFENFNNTTGVKKWTFTVPQGKTISSIEWWISGQEASTSDIGDIEVSIFSLVEGDKQYFDKLEFGLNSTQAVLDCNGNKFPLYASEEDRTNKKIILLPFAEDSITQNADGTGTLVDASGNCKIVVDSLSIQVDTNTGVIAFTNASLKNLIGANNVGTWMLSGMNTLTNDEWNSRTKTGAFYGSSATCGFAFNKKDLSDNFDSLDSIQKMAVAKNYLNNLNLSCTYTKSPTTTTIPKHLMPTIPIPDKNIILSVDSAVKPSAFTAKVPVDRIAELASQVQAIQNLYLLNTSSVNTNNEVK